LFPGFHERWDYWDPDIKLPGSPGIMGPGEIVAEGAGGQGGPYPLKPWRLETKGPRSIGFEASTQQQTEVEPISSHDSKG
jgi:hypothetical protein